MLLCYYYVVSYINIHFLSYNLQPGHTINTFALGITFFKKSGLVLLTHRHVFFVFLFCFLFFLLNVQHIHLNTAFHSLEKRVMQAPSQIALVREDLPRRHKMYKKKQIPLCLHKVWTKVCVVLWWYQCWEDREMAVQSVMVVC